MADVPLSITLDGPDTSKTVVRGDYSRQVGIATGIHRRSALNKNQALCAFLVPNLSNHGAVFLCNRATTPFNASCLA
jgi:hypothetical protein